MATTGSADNTTRSLYVGNIDDDVDETMIAERFGGADGKVVKVKIIRDKERQVSLGYGFVEFSDHEAAELGMKFSGVKLGSKELKVNWANTSTERSQQQHHPHHFHHHHRNQSPYQNGGAGLTGGNNNNKEQPNGDSQIRSSSGKNGGDHRTGSSGINRTPSPDRLGANGAYNVFVGELPESVDDVALKAAFQNFASLEDAKVMYDPEKISRGYGFLTFKEKEDASNAIQTVNGTEVFQGQSKPLKLNWAHAPKKPAPAPQLDFEELMKSGSPTNVTVYVGNLGDDVKEEPLRQAFAAHGEILQTRPHFEKGFCFFIFKEREAAARAIIAFNGKQFGNKMLKCHWGREKDHVQNMTGMHTPYFPYGPQAGANMHFPPMYANMSGGYAPQYGLPPGQYPPHQWYSYPPNQPNMWPPYAGMGAGIPGQTSSIPPGNLGLPTMPMGPSYALPSSSMTQSALVAPSYIPNISTTSGNAASGVGAPTSQTSTAGTGAGTSNPGGQRTS